ncbi:DNA topoisomerase IV subunit A [Arthrobacter sp. zg-Y916]|uniref:DNA topoisomerase (ATP-hydrolyzing) n=1 Tax=Arthrobacter caoxuetaonis TaxID=2886935 RepID=A0A9X1MHN6_9MICC|nr:MULTISPECIES: DNA topoisomerase IV subunit A [Arthrobacter]MCC3299092.1 DNA topoisomerase IV subunit A [Arthrobacter caoxuetaonis]MCC9193203.1 DNA topoisomerase IV subunit A [Arthrobacter sp. zg-Y916]USQ58574.1 DNA topoisomerase IV subunit A [Arthrobacter caoxuetaonis]
MARRTASVPSPGEPIAENIIDIDVTTEMEGSFLEYAYSVIYSRALPDARDGLKPVQRRILYMMAEMGLRPDRGHVKSARVVGEVMGKLHPHGDSAIYDAMVRMAQDWALRLPLIDGHGNFGSLDDGPAASRYTEARLAAAALTLTDHLDEDVVDFVPNYDNQLTQPEVLPAAFPNLLVNGASGIAVGMATNMAPHNLGEVIAAAQHLIRHPEATLEDIMRFVPGPDLPSGGRIVGLDGIRDAYATGRGSFKTRAKVEIEQLTARRTGLVVTELPYMVGAEKVIEKIKDAVTSKKLQGISDVVDLTDRMHGLRLVIELKNGFNPKAVLAQLYRYTPMEDSFGINNVSLVDGQPRTLGLVELLQVYVSHRLGVVRRRTAYRLGRKKDRLHLVEGLLIAIVDIDEVIQVIRSSEETAEARTRLMSIYDLTEIQANHILELRLRQLTKYSRLELEKEQEELRAAIEELQAILDSEERLRELVSDELGEVAAKYATPRRTVLLESEAVGPVASDALAAKSGKGAKAVLPLQIADEPCWVILSASGQLARTSNQEPLAEGGQRSRHDVFRSVVATTARGEIGAVTSSGRMIRVQVMDMPALPPTAGLPNMAGGVPAKEFMTLAKGEKLIGLVPLNAVLALGTRKGTAKRLNPDYPLNRDDWEAITLKPGDEVIGAAVAANDDDELVFATKGAQLLRFSASAVRPQGRTAGGVAGMKISDGDEAIFFGVVSAGDPAAVVVTVASGTETLPGTPGGSVKVTDFAEYPAKGRATAGVRAHRFLKGEDALVVAWAGHGPAKAAAANGTARALPTEHGRRDGSGVPLASPVEHIGPSFS